MPSESIEKCSIHYPKLPIITTRNEGKTKTKKYLNQIFLDLIQWEFSCACFLQ